MSVVLLCSTVCVGLPSTASSEECCSGVYVSRPFDVAALLATQQAQAAEFERQLSEKVAEIKASALEMEAKVREREVLEARHAEKVQVRCSVCQSSIGVRAGFVPFLGRPHRLAGQ